MAIQLLSLVNPRRVSGLGLPILVWLQEFLGELHDNGKTIITATHDLELALETSESCVILDERHRAVGSGRTEELLDDTELLLRANLIHEHQHRHGLTFHSHPHGHPD